MPPTTLHRRHPLVRYALACVLMAVSTGALHASVPKDLPTLIRPEAGHLDQAALQKAMNESVRAGVLFLVEELLDPANESGLIYPPHAARNKIGERTVTIRYSKEKRPIFEQKKVERLVPVRDEYGDITGYEKKMVEVRASDKIVGWTEVEVRDSEGSIERDITVPIFDHSNRMLPRGWWGMNAQGLLLLCRTGLANSPEARRMSDELEGMIELYGPPDFTWDLAWMAMAWMTLTDAVTDRAAAAALAERRDMLIGRLIDGAALSGGSRNPVQGLWGPVAINHELQAKFFDIELEIQKLYNEVQTALDAATTDRQRQTLTQKIRAIAKALGEVQRINKTISQRGRRLSEVDMPWKMADDLKSTGLSFYIYNRDLTDIDSTAVAAMAINAAFERELIPEITPRIPVQGRTIMKGLASEQVLEATYASLLNLADTTGSFDSGSVMYPISAYDDIPNLAGVPLAVRLPTLLRPETWHSNVSALAAIRRLEPVVGERAARRVRNRDEVVTANRERCLAIVEAYLASDPHHDEWAGPHAGESDSLEALAATHGWPQAAERDQRRKQATPIEDLSVGYPRSPRALLEPLTVLHHAPDDSSLGDAARKLAYRLMIEQQPEGSWMPLSPRKWGAPGLSSGEWAYLIGKLAKRHLWQVQHDQQVLAKNPIDEPFLRAGPWPVRADKDTIRRWDSIHSVVFKGDSNQPHKWGYPGRDFYQVDMRLAETLAAVVFLSEGLSEVPTVTADEIETVRSRAQDAALAYDERLQAIQADEELDEKQRQQQVDDLEREGPSLVHADKGHRAALHELWQAILQASGNAEHLAVLDAALRPEAPETTATNDDDANDAEAGDEDENENAGTSLDDILGG